jgi:iron(III) transport system ATP-binding protein
MNTPSPAGLEPFLSVRGLTKTFGTFRALDNINLDVAREEFVCFLGPSGCGKTTLLRAIAGLDLQDAGSIFMAGRDVSRANPAERDFGIVFQSYALFPNLSVSDNVGYGLVSQQKSRAETTKRVAELLDLVGLADQAAKYPVQLSGGQQQRVALARALATSPGLLLLDEPLSALDARVRLRLRDEIRALQKRLGVTTIMVTHDQEEALSMADRIVVMNKGRIEQIGTPSEIYERPATAFTADFVGRLTFLRGQMLDVDHVMVGNVRLACSNPAALAAGAQAEIAIRPEAVQIRDMTCSRTNMLSTVVTHLVFLGSFTRATLRTNGETSFSFVADFSANDMRDMGIAIDKPLTVVLPQDALRAFPARTDQG